MKSFIEIENLEKRYGDLHVLRGLNLKIPEGQVVSIIGPSGSGKSTLLRILMTLEKPDAGRIRIDGESIFTMMKKNKEVPASQRHLQRIRTKIGMVFQHFNLFPHMNVLRNVTEAPIHVLGLPKEKAETRATKVLHQVGLEDKLHTYPAQLSGGQKQRVAIARALAMEPRIMLFDEITSALDLELVSGILDLLSDLAKKGNMTMLIVTHQIRFARESSERILFFDHGIILEDGPPEKIFTNPSHERTKEFLTSVVQ